MNHEPTDQEVSDFIKYHPQGGSLDEIADTFGVSRQRAWQLLDGAVKKVKSQLSWRGIHSTGDVLSL